MKNFYLVLLAIVAIAFISCEKYNANDYTATIAARQDSTTITFVAECGKHVRPSLWWIGNDVVNSRRAYVQSVDNGATFAPADDYVYLHYWDADGYATHADSIKIHKAVSGRNYTATLRYLDDDYTSNHKEYYVSLTVAAK